MKRALQALLLMLSVLLFAPFAGAEEARVFSTELTPDHRRDLFSLPVCMKVLPGYRIEKTRFGFADRAKKVEFEATEIRATYKKVKELFSGDNVKNTEMAIKASFDFIWNGRRAALIKTFNKPSSEVNNISVAKWILITDMGSTTWMLSGYYDSKNTARAEEVLAMIKTSCIDSGKGEAISHIPAGSVEAESIGFKLAALTRNAVVYTKDGKLPTESKDEAVFLISKMKNPGLYSDAQRSAFAKKQIENMEEERDCEIISEATVLIDSLIGIEYTASTSDTSEEKGISHLTMLFDNQNIYLLAGIARHNATKNSQLFHELASTYKRN